MGNYIVYQEDGTGENINNLIVNERHSIGKKKVRFISTNYGPFHISNLVLRDVASNKTLVIDTDYRPGEMLQEATMRFAKPIYELLCITNENVGEDIDITYQVLGGRYQKDAAYLKNVYEFVANNNSPITWANVLNKPSGFDPKLHIHSIGDTVGFEVLNVALERIAKSIQLTGFPAFEALAEYINKQISDLNKAITPISPDEIANVANSNKLLSFNGLVQAARQMNFNTIKLTPNTSSLRSGSNIPINVDTTNTLDSDTLFWTIEHINTIDEDFVFNRGSIPIYNNHGKFNFQISTFGVNLEPGTRIQLDHGGNYSGPMTTFFNSSVGNGQHKIALTDGNRLESTSLTTIFPTPTKDENVTLSSPIIALNTMFAFHIANGIPNDTFTYTMPSGVKSPTYTLDVNGAYDSPANLSFPISSGDENREIIFQFTNSGHTKRVPVKILTSGTNNPIIFAYPSNVKAGDKQTITVIGGVPNSWHYIKTLPSSRKFRYFRIQIRRNGYTGPIVATSGLMTIDSDIGVDIGALWPKCCFKTPNIKRDAVSYYILVNKSSKVKSLDQV